MKYKIEFVLRVDDCTQEYAVQKGYDQEADSATLNMRTLKAILFLPEDEIVIESYVGPDANDLITVVALFPEEQPFLGLITDYCKLRDLPAPKGSKIKAAKKAKEAAEE